MQILPRLLVCAWVVGCVVRAQGKVDYQADVKFAIERIEQQCSTLLASKRIDWKKVTAPLLAESKKTKTDAAHLLLLWRLLARLQDGHAEVRPLDRGKGVQLEVPDRSASPGLFLCRIQGAVFVKNAWGPAAEAGLRPGMELAKVAGLPAATWLEQRRAKIADLVSFSTPQQAEFYTCHQGLADAPGTRLEVEVKGGAAKKVRTIPFAKGHQTPLGPAFPPAGLKGDKDRLSQMQLIVGAGGGVTSGAGAPTIASPLGTGVSPASSVLGITKNTVLRSSSFDRRFTPRNSEITRPTTLIPASPMSLMTRTSSCSESSPSTIENAISPTANMTST